jgi:hypothetical protein
MLRLLSVTRVAKYTNASSQLFVSWSTKNQCFPKVASWEPRRLRPRTAASPWLCQSAFGSYYTSSSQRIKRFDYTQLHALSQVWCGITCLTLRGRTRAALAMSLIKNEYSKDVNRVGPSTAIIIIQMANSHQQTDYNSSMHTAISTSSRLKRVLREATRSRRCDARARRAFLLHYVPRCAFPQS